MATVNALISRSLRMLNVLDHSYVMTSVQAANGLTAINAMLARWGEDGIALGWAAQTSGSATAPIPSAAETAVCANLAIEMSPEYPGSPPTEIVVKMADDGMRALLRDNFKNTIQPVTFSHLPPTPTRSFDINSGE